MFMDQESETCQIDFQDRTVIDSQVIFGLPNQVFAHTAPDKNNQQYKISFDENTLSLLPQAYPFLVNPANTNVITFDPAASQRVKATLSILFQLVHAPSKAWK
jgi:hypothetical protein